MRLSEEDSFSVTELKTVYTHIPNEVYQQILKDVARSGSHISQNAMQHEIDHFHEQLTQLICWVLHKHSILKLVLYIHLLYHATYLFHYNCGNICCRHMYIDNTK